MTDSNENDGRQSFDQAVSRALQEGQSAFCAMPVFGERTHDENQTAEGARVFIVEPDGAGDWQLRFLAGPFFANVHAANEILPPEEVPDSVRELRFLPVARVEEEWLDGQIQVLIQKLVQNSGLAAQLPDYESMPGRAADEEAVFPVHFIGRDAG